MNKTLDGATCVCYVHSMNNKDEHVEEDYRSLLLLDEISRDHTLTQRDLSRKLGVALGLVNSYLKNLVSKGYITVSAIPKKRYAYYLTPSGFAEKTRLTYRHLQNFTNLYKVARRDFHVLFNNINHLQIRRVAFCGVDEVTEIAYLSLRETDLELCAIFDINPGKRFLGFEVLPIRDIKNTDHDIVVITSFGNEGALEKSLLEAGEDAKKVCTVSKGGWLKKIEVQG